MAPTLRGREVCVRRAAPEAAMRCASRAARAAGTHMLAARSISSLSVVQGGRVTSTVTVQVTVTGPCRGRVGAGMR